LRPIGDLTTNEVKYLKKLRQYRIPIDEADDFEITAFTGGKSYNYSNSLISIVNISNQGCAFAIDKDITGVVDITFMIKKRKFEVNAKVIRTTSFYEQRGLYLVGLEYINIDEDFSNELISYYLNSLPLSRLKALMLDMIQNEGDVAQSKDASFIEEENKLTFNSSILFDLFKLFQSHIKSNKIIEVFANEVKRSIEAEIFSFYIFENGMNDVSLFDFEAGKSMNTLLPVTGAMATLRDTESVCVQRTPKSIKDPFYNLQYALYDKDVKNFILYPVIDKSGSIIGAVEFANKSFGDSFTEQCIFEVSIFSNVVGTSLSTDEDETIAILSKKYMSKLSKNLLIGPSEDNQYLNSFILECSKIDDRILISGEYGVGKKLMAINIHKNSERSEYGIGHINCHDLETTADIDKILESSETHTGLLELYSGGTLVFKDINFLNYQLGEYIFNKIKQRQDIRFLATTTESRDLLSHFSETYQPLIQFFAQREVRIPPLKERKEDIIPLAKFFVISICNNSGLSPKQLGADVCAHFMSYDWPGNISELKIAIDRLVTMEQDLKTLSYKRTRIMPLIDREIDDDFYFGIELNNEMIEDKSLYENGDIEELYFYFYTESLLGEGYEPYEIPVIFNMEISEFEEKIYHAHNKAIQYFGAGSEMVDSFLQRKVS